MHNNNNSTVNFFLVVPPPFEKLALKELLEKVGDEFGIQKENYQIRKGGIELEIGLEKGLALNHILKIPNRILLRLTQFKCRDFPKLFNKIKKMDWSSYLGGQFPKIHVSAKNSRVFDSRKIEKTIIDGLKEFYRAQAPKKKSLEKLAGSDGPAIYVDIFEDNCTLGIDTTGERLGKREQKIFSVKAPIRENLAAAVYYWAEEHINSVDTLFDPLCGSGTMLFEAASFHSLSERKSFSYQLFPKLGPVLIPSSKKEAIQKLWGNDLNSDALSALEQNASRLGLKLRMTQGDVLELGTTQCGSESLGIFSNLPYDKRIKVEEGFFHKLMEKLESFKPQWIVLIASEESKLGKLVNYNKTSEIRFSNGGLNVKAVLWQAD